MEALRRIDEALNEFASLIFWREQGQVKFFADLRQDLQVVRQSKERSGIHLCYGLPAYEQFVLALAAMYDAWTLAPLSQRYSWEQLAKWREQVPFCGIIGPNSAQTSEVSGVKAHQQGADIGSHLLIFSSGSTGQAKAIAHSASSLVHSALSTLDFYSAKAGEQWLLSLDMAHIGGFQIAMRCLLGGLCCVAGFAPHQVEQALETMNDLHYASLVPTQIQRLLTKQCKVPECLKAILLGGAAAPPALVREAIRQGWPLSVTYGSTETASQVSALRPGTEPEQAGHVGELFSHWNARVLGEQLELEGPALCLGWWQNRNFIPNPQGKDRLLLADRASLVGRQLFIHGRVDQIFQVGGENLAPQEILDALLGLHCEGDWLVLPRADVIYGEVPVLIFRGAKAPPSQDEIEAVLRRSLPRIKWPRACYWHQTQDVLKPAMGFYRQALELGQLECVWKRS